MHHGIECMYVTILLYVASQILNRVHRRSPAPTVDFTHYAAQNVSTVLPGQSIYIAAVCSQLIGKVLSTHISSPANHISIQEG